jgi:hypothetical protein
MNWFAIAERYHWTPEQIDALPAEFYETLPAMIDGLAAANDYQHKMAEAQAQRQMHSGQRGQHGYFPGSMT